MQVLSKYQRRRFDRMVECVHPLGSRAWAELLIELATSADCLALVLAMLATYAALTPGMMVAAHADQTLSHPLGEVP